MLRYFSSLNCRFQYILSAQCELSIIAMCFAHADLIPTFAGPIEQPLNMINGNIEMMKEPTPWSDRS